MTKNQPFFTHDRTSDTFMPTPVSNGPWDPNSLHGRVVVGLLSHGIEQRHGSDDFVPARLTVDMFRLPNTRRRSSRQSGARRQRIRVVEAEFVSGGTRMRAPPASYCARRKTRRATSGRLRTGMRRSLRTFKPTDVRLGMNGNGPRGHRRPMGRSAARCG
jgi:hypothetical protein